MGHLSYSKKRTTPELKPITVSSLGGSPNPWKIIIVLEGLNIPYEVKRVGMAEIRHGPYISMNPNGRVPTIVDSNTGITVWEVREESKRWKL